jgi:hypothetical protein
VTVPRGLVQLTSSEVVAGSKVASNDGMSCQSVRWAWSSIVHIGEGAQSRLLAEAVVVGNQMPPAPLPEAS